MGPVPHCSSMVLIMTVLLEHQKVIVLLESIDFKFVTNLLQGLQLLFAL